MTEQQTPNKIDMSTDNSIKNQKDSENRSSKIFERLLASNKSEASVHHMQRWQELRHDGRTCLVFGCVDARLSTPSTLGGPGGYSDGENGFAISAVPMFAGSIPDYGTSVDGLISSENVATIVSASHFDGDTFGKGAAPTGCGALAARNVMDNGGKVDLPAARFIGDNCISDPFDNSLESARLASLKATDKPVFAVAIDHLNQRAYGIGVYVNGNLVKKAGLVDQDYATRYSKTLNNLSVLDPEELKKDYPIFAQMLKNSQNFAAENEKTDMAKKAKRHNPELLLVTTNATPLATRFHGAFSIGDIMRLGVVRPPKSELSDNVPTQDMIQNVIESISYAMANATAGGHGFESTNTLLIETHSAELSRNLWNAIKNAQVVLDWQKSAQRTVAIAQTVAGKTESIEIIS